MFADVRGQLRIAGILPEFRYHKQGAAIISELLKKGSISKQDYYRLVGRKIGAELLEKIYLRYTMILTRSTFQSTLMKRYCE